MKMEKMFDAHRQARNKCDHTRADYIQNLACSSDFLAYFQLWRLFDDILED